MSEKVKAVNQGHEERTGLRKLWRENPFRLLRVIQKALDQIERLLQRDSETATELELHQTKSLLYGIMGQLAVHSERIEMVRAMMLKLFRHVISHPLMSDAERRECLLLIEHLRMKLGLVKN